MQEGKLLQNGHESSTGVLILSKKNPLSLGELELL